MKLEHISYSAIRQYLTNQYVFNKVYIEKIYPNVTEYSFALGTIVHAMIAKYIETGEKIEPSLSLCFTKNGEQKTIKYGKTQSKEKLLEEAQKVFNKYTSLRTRDYYGNVLGVEKSVVFDVGLGTPFKVIMDLVADSVVVDHKVVYSIGDNFEDNKWDLMLQGGFMALGFQNITGELPKQIIFDHIPRTDRRITMYPVAVDVELSINVAKVIAKQVLTEIEAKQNVYDFLINPFDMYGTEDFKEWVRLQLNK